MPLELLELPVVNDASSGHPCDGCQSGCCRSFVVPLSLGDIVRIARGTGLSFWDFAVRWDDSEDKIARGQVPHFHFQDEPQTPFVIGLKHVESQTFSGATRCRFLNEAPDGACCGVYEHRPMACRIFPATSVDDVLKIASIPQFGRPGNDPAYRLCARQWRLDDIDWSEKQAEFDQCRDEMALMRVLAERWNREPGDWLLLPEFLNAIWQRLAA